MIENFTWGWLPPYAFYFRVSFFQLEKGLLFNTSFSEVSGIGWNSEGEPHKDSERKVQEMQGALRCNRITLRSPLQPLPSLFEQWVNGHFKRMADTDGKGSIEAYDMLITLQTQLNVPVAAWLCSHAYPVSLSIGGLNAEKSEMAMETVVLTCNRIERQM